MSFFFVTVAFIMAGYGAALNAKYPIVAVVVAALGAVLCVWFNRLDIRTKELVRAGESALRASQRRLANLSSIPDMALLDLVETPKRSFSSYSFLLNTIHSIMFGFFAASAAYALFIFPNCRQVFEKVISARPLPEP